MTDPEKEHLLREALAAGKIPRPGAMEFLLDQLDKERANLAAMTAAADALWAVLDETDQGNAEWWKIYSVARDRYFLLRDKLNPKPTTK